MSDFHTSWIELSKSALEANLRFLQKRVGPAAAICAVVKGNAYGHGIETFVPLAESCGVRRFAVANADEALRAFNSRTADSDVMIMSSVEDEALEWAVSNRVQFHVFDVLRLQTAIRLATRIGIPARIHLEVETGLNRVGLDREERDTVASLVQDNSHSLTLEGVCTHFAGAESVGNYVRIQQQIQSFNEQCAWLDDRGIRPRLRHTACSAAALTYPETVMDMVRIGIALYGFWPSKETQMQFMLGGAPLSAKRPRDPLRRVLRWASRIMSVKSVPAGEFVGYGTVYMTTRRENIASIPVGYAHGFARSLSNNGFVLVHGRRAPVVGYVSMSVLLVDVTDIGGVCAGDEVVLIGKQGKCSITVGSFSDMSRNMNYEVLARLPSDIPRTVVD